MTKCSNPPRPPTDPRESGVWFGVALDWDHQTIAEYAASLGDTPAVVDQFSAVPQSEQERKDTDAAVDQARHAGSMLLLTLEPRKGLDAVTTAVAQAVAHQLDAYNRAGVPVIVRFGHEMNGSWFRWGQDPAAYVSAFRRVATAVHQFAHGSSMMWAPNYGGGYPFLGGRYRAKPGTEAFRLLDTNKDGRLTQADDAYAPYWPGAEYVDWVGISLYHWGTRYPWGANVVPEPGKFVAQLRGTYNAGGGDQRYVPDFYEIYGERMHRPVAITETAALYVPSRPGPSGLAIQQAWWRQLFADSVHQQLPWLRMINWFEYEKYEAGVGARVDWTVTRDPAIQAAFRADLPSWLRFAADVPHCTS